MTTRAVDILLEIMADAEMSTRRRIEAAEALLGFEAPPDAVASAREYLIEVADNPRSQSLTEWMRSKFHARRRPRRSRRKLST
jgi:hypothetical protein